MPPYKNKYRRSIEYEDHEFVVDVLEWDDPEHFAILQELTIPPYEPPGDTDVEMEEDFEEWLFREYKKACAIHALGFDLHSKLDDGVVLWTKGHPETE